MKQLELFKSQLIIFTSNSNHKEKLIKDLIDRQYQKYPDKFYGEVPCIVYKLNYVIPCQEFKELKNLILRIKENTGLRSEFRGIVAIHIDEWIDHVNEEYFIIFLKYLHDHSDYIQYIFYGEHDLRNVVKVAIEYLTISLQHVDDNKDIEKLYRTIRYHIRCHKVDISLEDTKYFVDKLMSQNIDLYNENIKESIILDMIEEDCNCIDRLYIDKYLQDSSKLVNMIGGHYG